MRSFVSLLLVELLATGAGISPVFAQSSTTTPAPAPTIYPIHHLVVIFDENISFDHYFGTYPNATNPSGEPPFTALPNTPAVNGLSGGLMTNNPNFLNTGNGTGAANPFRLDRSQSYTADQDHNYTPEQEAFHGGLMDLFPASVGAAGPPPSGGPPVVTTNGLTMGYYDGNTVTGFWNYAQHYAMSDNSYGTTFGPSTPGAVNLISGQTNGATNITNTGSALYTGSDGTVTAIGDGDPTGDVCSTTTGTTYSLTSKNIGDLLNAAGVTWGWFAGGFNLSIVNANGTTGCARSTTSTISGASKADYIQHHEPFQYYTSTQNLKHTRPTSTATIGTTDPANHQYDLQDFYAAVSAGNFPAVSFLKSIGIQDAHAGYSTPIDEQEWVVTLINFLQQQSGDWEHTAVVIAYDDSDGWYDHQMGPIMNQSTASVDALLGAGSCGNGLSALAGPATAHAQGRCGYGPRLPMMVISPWAKSNFVDHTVTDQTSIIHFVEDNWLNGERLGNGSFDAIGNSIINMFDFSKEESKGMLILDPDSGEIVHSTTSTPGFGGLPNRGLPR